VPDRRVKTGTRPGAHGQPRGLFIAPWLKLLTCDDGCDKPSMNKPPKGLLLANVLVHDASLTSSQADRACSDSREPTGEPLGEPTAETLAAPLEIGELLAHGAELLWQLEIMMTRRMMKPTTARPCLFVSSLVILTSWPGSSSRITAETY
jgi:hypothetical protein